MIICVIKSIFFDKLVVMGDVIMAKPIGPTPELGGEDAIEFLKRMYEPPTEKDKEFARKIRAQRNVPF